MRLKQYPRYKESNVEWLGKIPEEWESKRFKINFKYKKGKIPADLEETNGKGFLPYLSMEYLRGATEFPFFSNDLNAVKVRDGQLLLLWDGSNAGEFILGKEGYLSSTMVKFEIEDLNKTYSKYLCLAFEQLLRDLTIGMGIPHVNGDVLGNIRINIPSKEEQKTIANFLDKKTTNINGLLEKDKHLIELLTERRIALINHVVKKGLNPKTKFKDSGIDWIGKIPEEAKIMPFRRICFVNQGLQFTESDRLAEPDKNSKIYITIKFIHAKEEGMKEYIPNPPKSVVCKKEDVLLARTGATGEVVTNQEGVFHNNFFRINYDSRIKRDYLVYYLTMDSVKKILLLMAGITTIPDLSHDAFLDTPFIYYPAETQIQIAKYLDKATSIIDEAVKKIEIRIELLEEYKKSLIHNVVTGKVNVQGGDK